MMMVMKADGRREEFIPEKIIVSAIKTGATPDYARKIAQDIGMNTKETVSTREIKGKVLVMLKSKNPEWEKNWIHWHYSGDEDTILPAGYIPGEKAFS